MNRSITMLQEIPTSTLREGCSVVLETERLVLRQPTLADVKAIARLVNDRRVAENLRRVPHPYTPDHAVDFISTVARSGAETIFLIEHERAPIGIVGLDWQKPDKPELGYWLGVDHWRKGFATEAAKAVIDYAFEDFAIAHLVSGARVSNPASRRVLEKCGFQWGGVELHRFLALGCSTPVDRFRLDRAVWASLKSWNDSRRRYA
jgi:RimJ/RimL family protein N-acetyltransferase